jgi:hypothetical protein
MGETFLLFVDNGAPHPQDVTSVKCTVCLFIRFHKQDAYHCEWISLDAKKDVDLSSYAVVDPELPTCGIFSIDKYGMI